MDPNAVLDWTFDLYNAAVSVRNEHLRALQEASRGR